MWYYMISEKWCRKKGKKSSWWDLKKCWIIKAMILIFISTVKNNVLDVWFSFSGSGSSAPRLHPTFSNTLRFLLIFLHAFFLFIFLLHRNFEHRIYKEDLPFIQPIYPQVPRKKIYSLTLHGFQNHLIFVSVTEILDCHRLVANRILLVPIFLIDLYAAKCIWILI